MKLPRELQAMLAQLAERIERGEVDPEAFLEQLTQGELDHQCNDPDCPYHGKPEYPPLVEPGPYRVLGATPWMDREELESRFAERYRQARRNPVARFSQAELNEARTRLTEPRQAGPAAFWTFPLPVTSAMLAVTPEDAPPADEEAMRAALAEALRTWI